MRCAESQNPLAALSLLENIVVQSIFYQRDSGDNYKQGEIFNWKIAALSQIGMRYVEIDASGVNLFSHFA